ncbi:MAG: TraB/GumN family protein [Gammaproteobacteria bacterium]|nr:TraB/GumN family protein [Gammaproteobacteria bacterium]
MTEKLRGVAGPLAGNLLLRSFVFLASVFLTSEIAAQSPADYENLPGRKAMAAVPGHGNDIYGIGHSQPTDVAAANRALRECQRKLVRQTGVSLIPKQTCEVVHLNEERVTTGADIRARVPEGAHPLYLWRYTSASATVYLAGSIHVLKPTLYPLAPQLERAFEQSDLLVLEVDTEKYPLDEMQRKMMDAALLREGLTLKKVLSAALLKRLKKSLASHGIDLKQVAQFKPAMVMNQLVVLRLQALGYSSEYGLEQHFRSKLENRQILELESIDMQFDVLFNQPLDVQIRLLADTLEMEDEIEPLLTEILGAWLAGDDESLSTLILQQSGDSELAQAFNRRLLDDRNVGMAKTIRHYLDTPGRYFVLVGAAHFIGEAGIVNLLEQQGITGQRVMSDEQI